LEGTTVSDLDTGRRALPQNTVALVGHATSEVVGGIVKTPLMLAVLLLNIIGIGAAVYFLNILIQGQQRHLAALLLQQSSQQTELLIMHKHEFDALLTMIPRAEAQSVPTAPASAPPSTPPPQRAPAR
jgi:hypothetical protein